MTEEQILELSVILIFLLMLAVVLSFASLIIVLVFLLRTNKKLKGFVKSFKLFCLSSWVDKRMKPDNEYENFEVFFKEYEENGEKKSVRTHDSYQPRVK